MQKSYKFTPKNESLLEALNSVPKPFRGAFIEAMLCKALGIPHALEKQFHVSSFQEEGSGAPSSGGHADLKDMF